VDSWTNIVEILNKRGVDDCAKHVASMKLQVGATTPPDLKLNGKKSDVALGRICEPRIARIHQTA
jgi:hypothetical protein